MTLWRLKDGWRVWWEEGEERDGGEREKEKEREKRLREEREGSQNLIIYSMRANLTVSSEN